MPLVGICGPGFVRTLRKRTFSTFRWARRIRAFGCESTGLCAAVKTARLEGPTIFTPARARRIGALGSETTGLRASARALLIAARLEGSAFRTFTRTRRKSTLHESTGLAPSVKARLRIGTLLWRKTCLLPWPKRLAIFRRRSAELGKRIRPRRCCRTLLPIFIPWLRKARLCRSKGTARLLEWPSLAITLAIGSCSEASRNPVSVARGLRSCSEGTRWLAAKLS